MKGILIALLLCLCLPFVGCSDDGDPVSDGQVEVGTGDVGVDAPVGGDASPEAGGNDTAVSVDAGAGDGVGSSDSAADVAASD